MQENEQNKDASAIVSTASKAYGYNYASLADMARQGVKIPKMRLRIERNPITGARDGAFLEYSDGQEWGIGAEIVIPEMKGMNAAQRYGSALTYARRYTVAMSQGIATDDDDAVENHGPVPNPMMKSPATTTNHGVEILKEWLATGHDARAFCDFCQSIHGKKPSKDYTESDWAKVSKKMQTAVGGAK